ncbi:MAG: polysaccharide deacetylase [Lysobacteraceae bacterium]|nr:MAG: polysaccharide deacetylase [Xanthomonadaceae bacterium]
MPPMLNISKSKRALPMCVFAWLLYAYALQACAQSVAFSFDDGFDPRKQPEAAQWNARLLEQLRAARIEAMLFPAAGRVDSPDGLALVRAWGEAGHVIGNHTYSHRNLNAVAVVATDFLADVERADTLLKGMPGWRPMLRFPYLKEGGDAQERDAVRAWMAQHRYRHAPPSIDTSDWYYNQRFLAMREACPDCERSTLKQAYLAHLLERARYYDDLARRTLGRSPRHVLLLHANAINAEYLADVAASFRAAGWTIIAPMHAYRDKMYRMTPAIVPAGESIVWALAKARDTQGLRYPAEDGIYEAPKLDALGD